MGDTGDDPNRDPVISMERVRSRVPTSRNVGGNQKDVMAVKVGLCRMAPLWLVAFLALGLLVALPTYYVHGKENHRLSVDQSQVHHEKAKGDGNGDAKGGQTDRKSKGPHDKAGAQADKIITRSSTRVVSQSKNQDRRRDRKEDPVLAVQVRDKNDQQRDQRASILSPSSTDQQLAAQIPDSLSDEPGQKPLITALAKDGQLDKNPSSVEQPAIQSTYTDDRQKPLTATTSEPQIAIDLLGDNPIYTETPTPDLPSGTISDQQTPSPFPADLTSGGDLVQDSQSNVGSLSFPSTSGRDANAVFEPSSPSPTFPSDSPSRSPSITQTRSSSPAPSPVSSSTHIPTHSSSRTATPTSIHSSPSPTPNASPSPTQTATSTRSSSSTPTPSPSLSPTLTPTPSPSRTHTPTPSPSRTHTPTHSSSPTSTLSPTPYPSRTHTPTRSSSPTPTRSPSVTPSKSPKPTWPGCKALEGTGTIEEGSGNQPCTFPFFFDGKQFDSCTSYGEDVNHPWCAYGQFVAPNSLGVSETYMLWGNCEVGDACGVSQDDVLCMTDLGVPCSFPFFFGGKYYTACTDLDSEYSWCGIADKDLFPGGENWGYCMAGCPGY